MAEVDRVESVCGDGVGAAAAGCAGPPPFEPGHARIRVVQVGRRPRRAVQRVDVGAVQLLAAELHAGAQVVPYPARTEVRAEVRSEEPTSALPSIMRISYSVCCM